MRSSRALLVALVAALTLAGPATAHAQLQPRVRTDTGPYTQRASINLLGIPFGWVSGEYEGFVTEEVSLGGSLGIDENSESWGELKGRFYPAADGPRGLSVGMSVGFARIRATTGDCILGVCDEANGPFSTGATIGAVLDYSWLLGRRQRFYIGTGLGAKRVFGLDDRTDASGNRERYRKVLPSFRLQTGFAF